MLFGKFLADIKYAPGIGGSIAIEESGAVLDFGLGHHRIEPGPGVDVATDQRGHAVRMLKQYRLDIFLAVASTEQGPHKKNVRVGAPRHGYALAFEIGDARDRGVVACDQRGPFRT